MTSALDKLHRCLTAPTLAIVHYDKSWNSCWGQLAHLLALAGYNIGLQFQILDPAIDACAGQLAYLIRGNYEDISRLKQLAEWDYVVTFDFEKVPAAAAIILEEQTNSQSTHKPKIYL